MITIQVSATNQILALAIQYGTWSWADHVDMVLPDGNLLGALALTNGGGVQIHPMQPISSYSRVERYQIDAPESVLDFAKAQIGKPYDWSGVFSFITQERNWQEEDKWFCSEFVMYSFWQAGVKLLNGEAYRITPRDLLLSPLLNQVPESWKNNVA